MNSKSASNVEVNPTRGYLKLNSKIYPIFEGHNTVGRDPQAVINIKDLSISKHHAVITIFDEKGHYISDLKSANGTILDGKKLIFLKLYELKDGASIKFGDIFCTYKKSDGNDSIIDNVESSQNVSQSFYCATTQEIHVPKLPEGVDFNQLPTQFFTYAEPSINDMPTQIHNFDDIQESSNDSIDFITMQKAETQALENHKKKGLSSTPKKNSEELIHADPVNESNNMDENQSSQISPVKLNFKKTIDSDTEEELIPSQIKLVRTSTRNAINSDSDTEESILGKSKYYISDDSETDIEEETRIEEDNDENMTNKNNQSSMGSFRLELSNGANEETEEKEKKAHFGNFDTDHIYCQLAQKAESSTIPEKSEKIEETSETRKEQLEENETTNVIQVLNCDKEFDKQNLEKDQNGELRNEETRNEGEKTEDVTQKIDAELMMISKKKSEKEEQGEKATERNEENDVFNEATQQINTNFVSHKETEQMENLDLKDQENAKKGDKEEIEEIYLQPTQTLEYLNSQIATEDDKTKEADDNIYLQPTQVLENLHAFSPRTDTNQNDEDIKISENQLMEKRNEEDDSILTPTQALELIHTDLNQSTEKLKAEASTSRNLEDDILPSTQALETLLDDDNKTEENRCDPFLPPPAEFKTPSSSRMKMKSYQKVDEDDSFILQPTQALEALHEDGSVFNKVEDQMYEIFASQSLMATQQLVDVLDEDVIDDSINEESGKSSLVLTLPTWSLKKSISEDTVKEILGEGLEETAKKDTVNVSKKVEGKQNVKTYSRKTNKESKFEETDGDDMKKKDTKTNSKKKQDAAAESSDETEVDKSRGRGGKKQKPVTANDEKGEQIEEKRKSRKKQSTSNLEKSSSYVELNNKEEKKEATPQASAVENKETRRRGRSKAHADSLSENTESQNQESSSGEISEDSKKNETKNTESNGARRRSEKIESNTGNNKTQTRSETKNIQKKQNESKQTEKSSNEDIESTKNRTSRSKKNENQPEVRNTRSKKANEMINTPPEVKQVEIHTGKINKRKKTDIDNSETPKKIKKEPIANGTILKKSDKLNSSPKKRIFKTASVGSEDDFITKAPKLDILKNTPKTRKSTRNMKTLEESIGEDVISVSSTMSEDKVISISSASTISETRPKRNRRLSANSRRQKREEAAKKIGERPAIEALITPERNRRTLKPKVVFTMMDSPELESLIRQLGGSVVDSVDACTVLVAESVKRTLKLLCAVAQGKPVCSPKWLQMCRKANHFVDPWEHILVDKEAEQKWNFSLKETILKASKAKLLENYTFQLIVNNAADVLKGAIEACGGKVVTRSLNSFSANHLIIISTQDNKNKYNKIVKQNSKIKVVEPEAIFDGTLRQDFKFDKFYIT